MTRIVSLVCVALFGICSCERTAPTEGKRPNVLFIVVDDLNHWVRHLGRNEQVITPHIDALAKRGVTFANAYCAAPLCNPSRAAVMSGFRPSTSGLYENAVDWRPLIPESLTLTAQFKNHGYRLIGAGKIGPYPQGNEWHDYFDAKEKDKVCQPASGSPGVGGIRFGPVDCSDDQMGDYKIASWVIDQLRRKQKKPFFLACGLRKPHLPWYVPRKYYEMYPLDQIQLPQTLETDLDDIPTEGIQMAKPNRDHAAILGSGRWKEAVQGYMAAISFTDMNVGRIIEAVEASAYRDNTIIVFWGDHGWQLGEKQHWRKFALWEESTRAPFIWVVPGVTNAGGVCRRVVDFLSIYPTLADLCGLKPPEHVEGASIRPLLADPAAEWDRPAVTTCHFNNHAVRTEQWRYIRYANGGEELYDELKDRYEWNNLAAKPEFAEIKARLATHLPKINKPAPASDGEDEENDP